MNEREIMFADDDDEEGYKTAPKESSVPEEAAPIPAEPESRSGDPFLSSPTKWEYRFELDEIWSTYGKYIFKDRVNFSVWLDTKDPVSGISPVELIERDDSADEVMNILGRIAYGVF
ncbi:hypothetical protein [Spirosoma litoris]